MVVPPDLRSGAPAEFDSPAALAKALATTAYLADDDLVTAAYLAAQMGRPLFCEGEPGTGKTALAQVTLDWAQALQLVGSTSLDPDVPGGRRARADRTGGSGRPLAAREGAIHEPDGGELRTSA